VNKNRSFLLFNHCSCINLDRIFYLRKMDTKNEFFVSSTFQNPLSLTLPTPLQLQGYEVSLDFISLPSHFYNFPKSHIEVRLDEAKETHRLPIGFYKDVADLVGAINSSIGSDRIRVEFDERERLVNVNLSDPRVSIKFSSQLAAILRLPSGTIKNRATSTSHVAFSGAQQVFLVTTNFTVPQFCNGRFLPVLTAVQADQQFCGHPGRYVPVQDGLLEKININIVSSGHLNNTIVFLSGIVTIVLHFRKKHE
jgi:hypothetical protein